MPRLIEPELAIGHTFEPKLSRWSERDVALYALATGAADDPSDDAQLRRVYEHHADGMEPMPGFFAVVALNALVEGLRKGPSAPGLNYGIDRVMHAEERVEWLAPLPVRGTLSHRGKIADILDKGRHAYVITEVESRNEQGELALRSTITSLVRSAGGFAPEKAKAKTDAEGTSGTTSPPLPPPRAPDLHVEQKTHANQALLFRLLGDDNPLHADPAAARAFGLRTPILHGMCTVGFALRHLADGFGRLPLREVSVRFSDVVFPGDTLLTEAWCDAADPHQVSFETRVKERNKVVLSNGRARFDRPASSSRSTSAPSVSATGVATMTAASDSEQAKLADAVRAIARHVAARPALARSVGAAFQFRLAANGAPAVVEFVVDLRREPGAVHEGSLPREEVDCLLELSAADFFALKSGAASGRGLYMSGALKMTGRTSLAPHLDFLREVGRDDATHTGAVRDDGGADDTNAARRVSLARIAERLAEVQQAVRHGAATTPVVVRIVGEAQVALVSNGNVAMSAPAPWPTNAPMISFSPDGARKLAEGAADIHALFMRGEVRIEGDISVVRTLDRALHANRQDGEATP